ncbi:rhodanese-like domain-containing protein [Pontibacter oryzae]|uniref:Rhodanese-like domain-containing protein n=2 Tax=Pontibacter oryzae TaxID=2304593 RepID=A0A399RXE0_9BACT|nr:rhodanese-like domain-containing protein [Pontibacter oryzae]
MLKGLYKNSVPFITPAMLQAKIDREATAPLILDTRQPEEYAVSHIAGSRFVNYDTFKLAQLNDVPKDRPVVVYCTVGYRSERVSEKLKAAGYTNVLNLYGGIFEWVNRGYPVYNSEGKTAKVHAYSKAWGKWLQKGEKVYGSE